jgi:glutathione synthase/RimK-type ligase-like ATP-grasp enzyme
MVIEYHIKVTGPNAEVISRKESGEVAIVNKDHKLRKGKDKVKFTSDDKTTVIQYRNTSPFAEREVGAQTIVKVGDGSGKGPFLVVNKGDEHHFDCGFINPATNEFSAWGRTDGADTPVDDGSGGGPG